MKKKYTAIVLAGGRGSRMQTKEKKQFLQIQGKPVLYYSLIVFQECPWIDEIVLVCGTEDIERCREEIVKEYRIDKIKKIVPGGKERVDSVYEGLRAAEGCDYVLIHDGARPFVDAMMLERTRETLYEYSACTIGMPVKDTIKISDEKKCVEQTLPREKLWMIQTPQSFQYEVIRSAHDQLKKMNHMGMKITDDAMIAEEIAKVPVCLVEGSYQNIKITTSDDLLLAEMILKKAKEK